MVSEFLPKISIIENVPAMRTSLILKSGIKKRLKAILPRLKMGTILTGDIFIQCNEKRNDLMDLYYYSCVLILH